MQKANGSWTKVCAVTMLLCLCLGAAYGWHSVQKEKDSAPYWAKYDATHSHVSAPLSVESVANDPLFTQDTSWVGKPISQHDPHTYYASYMGPDPNAEYYLWVKNGRH